MAFSGVSLRKSVQSSAHLVVCGNEKGGSGKSTTCVHIAVSLLKQGFRVATVDLDGRQLTLTSYIANRRRWMETSGIELEMPTHFHVAPARRERVSDAENEDMRKLTEGLAEVGGSHDFIVIDTPGSDTFLSRFAHRVADTLVTPMNDSFIDFDVMAKIDPVTLEVNQVSHYAAMVRDARRERRLEKDSILDWIVVRNRMAPLTSRNEQKVDSSLAKLSMQLGFRVADGISERVIFREFFPIGLTALDELDAEVLGKKPTLSHLAARQEIRRLVTALRLPTDELGRKRAEARQRYAEMARKPLVLPDIFAL